MKNDKCFLFNGVLDVIWTKHISRWQFNPRLPEPRRDWQWVPFHQQDILTKQLSLGRQLGQVAVYHWLPYKGRLGLVNAQSFHQELGSREDQSLWELHWLKSNFNFSSVSYFHNQILTFSSSGKLHPYNLIQIFS